MELFTYFVGTEKLEKLGRTSVLRATRAGDGRSPTIRILMENCHLGNIFTSCRLGHLGRQKKTSLGETNTDSVATVSNGVTVRSSRRALCTVLLGCSFNARKGFLSSISFRARNYPYNVPANVMWLIRPK